jgi:hypothetical protein
MRLFSPNLIDAATITASSENDLLLAANVANELRTKVWRTGGSLTAEWIKFDLGAAKAVTGFIIANHTLSTDTLVALEGNATDSWGSPSFTQAVTLAAGTILTTFASQSYRWWRFRFSKPSSATQRDIGRIFLGTYVEPADLPDWNGVQLSRADNTSITKSVGGQEWADRRGNFREVGLTFTACSTTTKDAVEAVVADCGVGKSLFVQPDTNTALAEALYVRFSKLPEWGMHSYDGSGFRWNVNLEFREQV